MVFLRWRESLHWLWLEGGGGDGGGEGGEFFLLPLEAELILEDVGGESHVFG